MDKILKLPAVEAAPLLLGYYLTRQTPDGPVKVKIVETEAYHQADPASHSFAGNTARTWPMFEAGGRLYVYFSYGMHHAINIVTGPAGSGEGVLIRAGEPIDGVEIMQENRGKRDMMNLTNGPGKLAQALGIKDTSLSGKILISVKPSRHDLSSEADKIAAIRERYKSDKYADVFLEPNPGQKFEIATTSRVGITKAADQLWRFYIKDNPYVSKR